jgi:hypothetical protein
METVATTWDPINCQSSAGAQYIIYSIASFGTQAAERLKLTICMTGCQLHADYVLVLVAYTSRLLLSAYLEYLHDAYGIA